MLAEIYIEALLVDEELADMVWEAWRLRDWEALVAWIRVVHYHPPHLD